MDTPHQWEEIDLEGLFGILPPLRIRDFRVYLSGSEAQLRPTTALKVI